MNLYLETIENDFVKKNLMAIQDLGFNFVSIGFSKIGSNNILGVFSNKYWQNTYKGLSLYQFDPLLESAKKNINIPVLWNAVPLKTKKSAGVMKIRNEIASTESGITYCIENNGISSVIAIGGKEDQNIFLDKYIFSLDQILLISRKIQSFLEARL